MEPTSERARMGFADYRAALDLDQRAQSRVLERIEASIASGEASAFADRLDADRARSRASNWPARAAFGTGLALAAGLALWWAGTFTPRTVGSYDERAPVQAAAAWAAPTSERATQRIRGAAPRPRVDRPVLQPVAAVEDVEEIGQVEPPRTERRPPPAEGETKPPAIEPGQGGSDLKAELALIRNARRELDAQRFDEATRLLDRHDAAFPHGQLTVEREALREELKAAIDAAKR